MESLQRLHKLQDAPQRMQQTRQQPEQEAEFLWAGYRWVNGWVSETLDVSAALHIVVC